MENKYYIPTIDEFHIGFEYEYKSCHEINNNMDWIKQTMHFMDMCDIGLELNNDPNISWQFRVKYLDKEDIESLGFGLRNNYELFDMFCYTKLLKPDFHRDGIELIYHYDNNRLVIQSDIDHFNHGERVYFDGYIKNKSELKVLLKQLSIS